MPKKKPLTKEDVFGKNPVDEDFEKEGLTTGWLAKNLKSLGEFKEDVLDKENKIQKLDTAPAARVRKDSTEMVAQIRGWKKEKVEHSGTIIFQSNVPEPDPLPEEGDD